MKQQKAAINRVKYLYTTSVIGIVPKPSSSTKLSAHVDANWAGEREARSGSQSGVVIYYRLTVVHYRSWLKTFLTINSSEAEYVALSISDKTMVWSPRTLSQLGINEGPTVFMQNNSGTMRRASGHPVEHLKMNKHVEDRYHSIREKIGRRESGIKNVFFTMNAADLFTKVLGVGQIKSEDSR